MNICRETAEKAVAAPVLFAEQEKSFTKIKRKNRCFDKVFGGGRKNRIYVAYFAFFTVLENWVTTIYKKCKKRLKQLKRKKLKNVEKCVENVNNSL